MNATRKTICLSMIVKNKAPVIRRCIDSVRPLIDAWFIVDTGSTDGTQDIIREVLADLPGALLERPWVDFAYNRSEALTLARDRADYTLIIDADDTIEIPVDFDLPDLVADEYSIEIRDSSTQHRRRQLVRNTLPWRYEVVLHEFFTCEGAQPGAMLEGVFMRRNHDGARRRDPSTYRRDAQMLEAALAGEVSDFLRSCYTFYLAQSYQDFGEKEKALQRYLERAELGFCDQERFISLYQAAQLKADLGHRDREVINTYLHATEACPFRAEALHGASRHCRNKGLNEEGFQLAKRGLAIAKPEKGLFVEPWIYQHGLLDELAVNGYWSGHYRESLDAGLRLLSHENCTPDRRSQFVANAQAALQKLPRDPSLGTYGTEGLIEQHALVTPRQLHSRITGSPRVFMAILAKQKESALPFYLECIESLDYPKSSIVLYIRTNNNTDATEQILRNWVLRIGHLYSFVEFDSANVEDRVEQFGVHEWNAIRFRVLGHIRNVSLRRALEQECDFYFVADVDNFIRPQTLRELIALNLPIVSPLLRSIAPGAFYSNYHAEVDSNGYYKDTDQYQWILSRWCRGLQEVPVVHCTYLIRADVLDKLTYQDGTERHEYVVFSESARNSAVPQYIDNRQIYGYITFEQNGAQHSVADIEHARMLLNTASVSDPSNESECQPPEQIEERIRQKFSQIYDTNEWGYGSGVGSLAENNAEYIDFVQTFIQRNNVKSVVDFGCGDWQFSRLIDWGDVPYVGFDLVPSVIEANRSNFARTGVSFQIFESLDQLPSADLLLCKDVFQHLPNKLVTRYLAAFKDKFKFLLITNDDRPESLLNGDIQAGGWRPVRLDAPPFSEVAMVQLSWTITGGGWKPTHKATFLIQRAQSTGNNEREKAITSADQRMEAENETSADA